MCRAMKIPLNILTLYADLEQWFDGAQRRTLTSPKVPKDLAQARELIAALDRRNPAIMRDEIESVMERGQTWRKLMRDGMKLAGLPPS